MISFQLIWPFLDREIWLIAMYATGYLLAYLLIAACDWICAVIRITSRSSIA